MPPSAGYYRRASVEYGSRTVLSRKTSWRCTPYKVFDDDDCAWLMADCWGTKEQIEVIKKIGDAWLTKDDGKARTVKDSSGKQRAVEPFGVGDISGFNGGAMACHAGHRDGNSTDLNRTDSNPICHTGVYTDAFHREETYELCKMLIAGGTNKIQFNCHHVIKNIEKAQELKDHHNHIHFDGPRSTGSAPMLANRFTTCGECGFYDKCEVKIKEMKNANGEWEKYDPLQYYATTNRGSGAIRIDKCK